MYNINRRKQFKTVGDLKKLLANVSDDTTMVICGDSCCWFHIEEDESVVCLDCEDLDDCYEYDDDDDFLQGLMDDAETEETINIWIEQLLESTGKSNVDEFTTEEILVEIEDVKGTIRNEEIVLGISEFAEKNIEQYEAYLEVLEEMLNNKEEQI